MFKMKSCIVGGLNVVFICLYYTQLCTRELYQIKDYHFLFINE